MLSLDFGHFCSILEVGFSLGPRPTFAAELSLTWRRLHSSTVMTPSATLAPSESSGISLFRLPLALTLKKIKWVGSTSGTARDHLREIFYT
jgi:hypothetical protein